MPAYVPDSAILLDPELVFGEYTNSFRLLGDGDQEILLDLLVHSAHAGKAEVLGRFRMQPAALALFVEMAQAFLQKRGQLPKEPLLPQLAPPPPASPQGPAPAPGTPLAFDENSRQVTTEDGAALVVFRPPSKNTGEG